LTSFFFFDNNSDICGYKKGGSSKKWCGLRRDASGEGFASNETGEKNHIKRKIGADKADLYD